MRAKKPTTNNSNLEHIRFDIVSLSDGMQCHFFAQSCQKILLQLWAFCFLRADFDMGSCESMMHVRGLLWTAPFYDI